MQQGAAKMKNYDEIRKQAWQRIEAHRAEKGKKNPAPTVASSNIHAQSPNDDHKLTNFSSKDALMEHLLGGN